MYRIKAASVLVLLALLVSCGGGGGSAVPYMGQSGISNGGSAPAPVDNTSAVEILYNDWTPGELPGTIPDSPANVSQYLMNRPVNEAAKSSSATTLARIATGNIAVIAPDDDFRHDPVLSDAGVWVEGQLDPLAYGEYHVHGTITDLELGQALGTTPTAYASIGLITWDTWTFAQDPDGDGNPIDGDTAYMFNQSIYLIVRRVATDLPGEYRVRMGDHNGKWGSAEARVPLPIHYDLKLEPHAISSTPALPPYETHDVGLATLLIEGTPIGTSVLYGDDNWGWRTAIGPEFYDLAHGGTMLIGQVYASGDIATNTDVESHMEFDATYTYGPLWTPPSEWWCFGQSQRNNRSSIHIGPQLGNPLWIYNGFGAGIDSTPVVAPDGKLYIASNDGNTYAINPDGTLQWTVATPGVGFLAGPAINEDGTVYIGSSTGALYAITDNGATGTLKWTLPLGAAQSSQLAIGFNSIIYFVNNDNQLYAVRDDGAGATIMWTQPLGSEAFGAPAISSNGMIYVCDQTGALYAVRDNGGSATIMWAIPKVFGNAGPLLGPGSRVYYTSGNNVVCITDTGAAPFLNWSINVPTPHFNGSMALGPDGTIYAPGGNGTLFAITDNGASAAVKWTFNTGARWGSPAVGDDGVIYLGCSDPPHTSEYIAVSDDGASASLLWTFPTGQFMGFGASPIITENNRLIGATTGNMLISFDDAAPPPVIIDCTALANASLILRRPDTSIISGPLTTNSVHVSAGALSDGDQFYVSFEVDNATQPSDIALYPDVPAVGLVTISGPNLVLDPALAPYFTTVGRTLFLRPGVYSRITNDVSSLGHALYYLFDQVAALTMSGPHDTDSSATDTVVIRDAIEYRPVFAADLYPIAGSSPTANGSPETIYPVEFPTGWIEVFGDIPGLGAAPALIEGGTVLGDYYDQAGLVNTLQADAYCRFEPVPGAGLVANYGFFETTIPTWILPSFPGLEPQAEPHDALAFARGTTFQVESGGDFSSNVTVDPGQLLNGATSVTLAVGVGSIDLDVIPVRVWDDVDAIDPDLTVVPLATSWQVTINFLMQYGVAAYLVELDADYDGVWDSLPANRTYPLNSVPFATTGLISDTVDVLQASQPAGNYTFAIRVTDINGNQYIYAWPNPVNLPSLEPIEIDCTSLVNANFRLFRELPGVPGFVTPDLTTNAVYNASGDLNVGDQFYVSFDVDPLLAPSDIAVYPPRPDGTVGGLVTVNAVDLTIAPSLAPYFTSVDRVLTLTPAAYTRVINDVSSLTWANYSLTDAATATVFTGLHATNTSALDTVVLADTVTYRPVFTPEIYPLAGADPAFAGMLETIYPQEFTTGWIEVDSLGTGTLIEGGTILGNYFAQFGMTNVLDSDAYCRFEAEASDSMAGNYGFWDINTGAWIVPSSIFGPDPNAEPSDVFTFLRGTTFRAESGVNFSTNVSVDPLQLLNGGTQVVLALGADTLTLRVIPDRIWDDPALPDPGDPGTIVITGLGWDVTMNFVLQYGEAPYLVEVDTDYDGTWDSAPASRVHAMNGSPFAAPGLVTDTVSIPAAQGSGSYNFAMRVTDNLGAQYTYVYDLATPITLPNIPPVASLIVGSGETVGSTPHTVNFDASASIDPDNPAGGINGQGILDFEWDFDGNGTFNEAGAEAAAQGTATPSYTYVAAATYTAAVRVSDNVGATDTETIVITVNPPAGPDWAHTWGGGLVEEGTGVGVDSLGAHYLVGNTNSFAPDNDVVLTKFDAAGNWQWTRRWGSMFTIETSYDLAVDGEDNVVITGTTGSAGSTELFVIKFDTFGSLLWQRTWSGGGNDGGMAVCTVGSNIYVAGYTDYLSPGTEDVLMLELDQFGNLVWQRAWGGAAREWALDIAANPAEMVIVGQTSSFGSGTWDVLVICFPIGGSMPNWTSTWGDAFRDGARGVTLSLSRVYVSGWTESAGLGSDYDALLMEYDITSGNPNWIHDWAGLGTDTGHSVSPILGGVGAYFAGTTTSFGDSRIFALKTDAWGNLTSQQGWVHPLGDSQVFAASATAPDGALVLGGIAANITGASWQTNTGTYGTPVGSLGFPMGTVTTPAVGLSSLFEPVVTPPGVLDTGGGNMDKLILHHVVP